jgi:hypothetical protein
VTSADSVILRRAKMLACIACSAKEGGEDGPRAAAMLHGKDAVKSLTSQVPSPSLYLCSAAALLHVFLY